MDIAVLGAGSWGTTIAVHLAAKGERVRLWEVFKEAAEILREKRENTRFLPSIRIPDGVLISSSLEEVLDGAKAAVIVVPSHCMREVAGKVGRIGQKTVILSAAKGIEEDSLKRMSEVIREEVPGSRVCVLSGPSHAEEVSRNIPTTVVVSSEDESAAGDMQKLFMTDSLRVYTNPDMVGVELGGALKNIIAIASGISDGLGFGDNTKAAILTRGLAEITRLGTAMGANPATFAGLTGMGDLVTTCVSQYSRNRKLGELLAQEKSLDEALSIVGQVAEGVRTTKCAYKLAEVHKVDMPITEQVYAVLFQRKNARSAASGLMVRTARPELETEFLGNTGKYKTLAR